MKALVQDRYGSYEVLGLADVDQPVPGAGEVLVEIRAAGVDPSVWHLMTGLPRVARLAFGVRRPRDRVRGRDLAGQVAALGPGVTGFAVGDEVFGVTTKGSFAEYATARVDHLAAKPAGLTFEQAAVLPVSGCTALAAMRRAGMQRAATSPSRPGGQPRSHPGTTFSGVVHSGGVRAGQRVLVIGAGGGVGTYVVQLAARAGAEVTGVCSTTKVELVRSLGAAHVVDYRRGEPEGRWDVVFNVGGMRPLRVLRRLLTPDGTLLLVGGEDDGKLFGGNQTRLIRAMLAGPFTRQRLRGVFSAENQADLRTLASAGLTMSIDRTFPLAEAGAALRYLMEGHARGKVVVTI